jgi:hypothetical protein
MQHSLSDLFERCSRLAGEAFARDRLRAPVWVTQDANGDLAAFDQPCDGAPSQVSDSVALEMLCDEMRTDFAYDRVTAYAVGFIGPVTFIGVGLAILAKPPSVVRRVAVVEAHDANASLIATREILGNRLGPLQRHAQARPRFGGLLPVTLRGETA